jgi:hypothetical protein
MRGFAVLVLALSACIGGSVTAMTGVSHATDGRTRATIDTALGVHTRGLNPKAYPEDSATLVFFGLVPQATYAPDGDLIAGGVLVGVGANYYRGRGGFGWLLSAGGKGARDSEFGVAGRVQFPFELELGKSDWRIDRIDRRCGLDSPSYVPRIQDHTIFGLVPGIERFSGEWSASLSVSIRRIYGPPC